MEAEQAQRAVQPMEAAPNAGAENVREQAMSMLLEEGDEAASEPGLEVADDGMEGVTEVEEDSRMARNFRGRWDHLDEQERRVVELTTKRGLTLGEACRAVYGAESGPVPVEEVPTTPKGGVQARRTARPMPAGGVPVEAPVATLERRVAGARSTGDMLELMREIGTPFEALLKR